MGYVDETFKINSKYNFLLRYERNYPNDYFYFNQSNYPLYAVTPQGVSYRPINPVCKQATTQQDSLFQGLSISTQEDTYLDGNTGGTYHFSIGANKFWKSKQIPGPFCGHGIGVYSVDLWLQFLYYWVLNKLPYDFSSNEINPYFKAYQFNICFLFLCNIYE